MNILLLVYIELVLISKQNLTCIFLGKRKTLISGSAPTENLPKKSHEAPKRER